MCAPMCIDPNKINENRRQISRTLANRNRIVRGSLVDVACEDAVHVSAISFPEQIQMVEHVVKLV